MINKSDGLFKSAPFELEKITSADLHLKSLSCRYYVLSVEQGSAKLVDLKREQRNVFRTSVKWEHQKEN